ncbi:hypothetical protein DFO46_1744 [Rhizobium sp. AG855]|nr:hypothetical protein DFO46_1744 [Rhizobium sp. AG855]
MVRKFVTYFLAAVSAGCALVVIWGVLLASIEGSTEGSGGHALDGATLTLIVLSGLGLLLFGVGDAIALVSSRRRSSSSKSNATLTEGGHQTANEASDEAKRNRDRHA